MSDQSDDQKVADEIKREIARIGDSTGDAIKKLREGFERDLAAARTLAAEGKGYTDAQVKAHAETAVAKHEALENALKAIEEKARALDDRNAALETAFRRGPGPGVGGDEAAKADHAHAVEFKRMGLARSGRLRLDTEVAAGEADVDEFREYRKAFRSAVLLKSRELEYGADEQKALRTGVDPEGGYLVTPAMSDRIVRKVYETSPLRQLATVEVIGTSELEIAVDDEEVGAGWVGEEEARPETGTPRLGKTTIRAEEMYAKPKATQILLEDATRDVEAWLAGKIAEKFGRIENAAFVAGNGINKPRGILAYPAGTARGQVKQVASGNSSAVTADALVALPFELKEFFHPNARWLLKRSTMAAISLFKDSTGQYLWSQGLRDGAGTFVLAGYPVAFADDMPAVAAGSLPIGFGDWRAFYTIVERLGIRLLRDPYSAKPFVEFYARRRVGGGVVDSDAAVLLKVSA